MKYYFWLGQMLVVASFLASAHHASASPEKYAMRVQTGLHQAVVYAVEVVLPEGCKPCDVLVGAAGFFGEWRVTETTNRGGACLEISPDVSRLYPQVSGRIELSCRGEVFAEVSVNGQVAPEIKVMPARWHIGPLALDAETRGRVFHKDFILESTQPGWRVEAVEVRGLKGVECRVERESPTVWSLRTTCTLAHTLEDKTVSQLMRGQIRVQTSAERQPTVWIPVTLLVSQAQKHGEPYRWRGAQRWEGWFGTPNRAAAFLLPLVGVCAGLFLGARKIACHQLSCAVSLVSGVCLGWVLWLLALTYSRGGWVGLGMGGLCLMGLAWSQRWKIMAGLLVFGALVVMVPGGADRAASTVSYGEDRSASNRLAVWAATLHLIADHPWNGVGEKFYEEELKTWYQPTGLKHGYSMALSDPLTVAAYHGIPMLALVAGCVGAVLLPAARAARADENILAAGAVAGLAGVIVASFFSYLLHIWAVAQSGVLVAAGLGIWLLCRAWSRGRWSELCRLGVEAGISAVGISVACAGLCLGAATVAQMKSDAVHHPALDPANGEAGWVLYPPAGATRGDVLVITDRGEAPASVAKSVLRPLAAEGWRVWVYPNSGDRGKELVKVGERVWVLAGKNASRKISLYGRGEGGAVALLASCRPEVAGALTEVTAYQPPYASGLKEYSPMEHAAESQVPVTLEHEDEPGDFGFRQGMIYREVAARSRRSVRIVQKP